MKFDTILDMSYHFEELTVEQIQALLSCVVSVTYGFGDLLFYRDYADSEHHPARHHLMVKETRDDARSQIERYIKQQDLPLISTEDMHLCRISQCWDVTAGHEKHVLLFDECGEDLHIIYHVCKSHLEPVGQHILETLQIKALPDEKGWQVDDVRVASWQGEPEWTGYSWYSQRIWEETDGDYETGYNEYTTASPHLGPFESRALAVIAAQEWEI